MQKKKGNCQWNIRILQPVNKTGYPQNYSFKDEEYLVKLLQLKSEIFDIKLVKANLDFLMAEIEQELKDLEILYNPTELL